MELFILVCEGVQHAHQKAIIHRDLKPSNILVSEIDGKPMPRIIDFGVAKAISQKLSGGTMHTQLGSVIGTLGYMSPEQADSAGEDIDTRSDVYPLGAILYELLVSALPLDLHQLAFDEVLRRLRNQDAPRPSTRLRTLGESSALAAKNRGADPPALVRQLRGDPDAIALKALEKDRKRRYASASNLAEDIGRYLRDEPVTAQPPSAAYLARKYVRRHRLGVAMAAAGLLLLVGFAVAQAVELRRISRERDRADRISQFMTKMFKVSNPSQARGNAVTAREILDKASADIDAGLKDDPELQAKMMFTMALTYEGLGLYPRAQSLLQRALVIQQRALGPRNPETLRSMTLLAECMGDQGHYAEEEKLARSSLDLDRKVLGPKNRDTLLSTNMLGIAFLSQGRFPEAENVLTEALDLESQALGPENSNTLVTATNLAYVLMEEGKLPKAEKLYRQALDIQRRTIGSNAPETLTTMSYLGTIADAEGHYVEAEKLQREALATQQRVLGPEHQDTLISMNFLAETLTREGNYAEAEKLDREALQRSGSAVGSEAPATLYAANCLAGVLEHEGQYPEAEKLERQTLDTLRRVLGPANPETIQTAGSLALTLSREGRYREAETLSRAEIQVVGNTGKQVALAGFWYNFACAAAIAGRRDEALDRLGHAISLGYNRADAIAADPDLKSLHGNPRFDASVAKARQDVPAKAQ
jgi:non-specific serine/threonine protein kinase/serine/threonine-protein kinase